jgi:hypothetical protein
MNIQNLTTSFEAKGISIDFFKNDLLHCPGHRLKQVVAPEKLGLSGKVE